MPERERDARPEFRVQNLDLLRACAALAVCAFHFREPLHANKIIHAILSHGYLGVDAFFVISGFVIPLALHRSKYTLNVLPNFLARRFIRLYPAYFCACALAMVLWVLSSRLPGFRGSPPAFSFAQVVSNFTLTADYGGEAWFLPVFWTLAVEAQYYFAIACIFPLLRHRHEKIREAVIMLWVCTPLILPVRGSPLPFFALFGMGILFFLGQVQLLRRKFVGIGCSLAFLVQCQVGDFSSALAGILSLWFIGWFPHKTINALAHIGAISYSIYLLHVPIGGRVINFASRYTDTSLAKVTVFIGAFLCTYLAAFLFFRWIEQPSHALARSGRSR